MMTQLYFELQRHAKSTCHCYCFLHKKLKRAEIKFQMETKDKNPIKIIFKIKIQNLGDWTHFDPVVH